MPAGPYSAGAKGPSQFSRAEELGWEGPGAAVLLRGTERHKDLTDGQESTGTLQAPLHRAPRGLGILPCFSKKERID